VGVYPHKGGYKNITGRESIRDLSRRSRFLSVMYFGYTKSLPKMILQSSKIMDFEEVGNAKCYPK